MRTFFLKKISKVDTRSYGMIARKRFEYAGLLNYHLKKLRESGVLDQLYRRHAEPMSRSREFMCSSVGVNERRKKAVLPQCQMTFP